MTTSCTTCQATTPGAHCFGCGALVLNDYTATAATVLAGHFEILADDGMTGHAVADQRGNLIGTVETVTCRCCWTCRVLANGQLLGGPLVLVAECDDALDALARLLGQDVDRLELVDL